MHTRYVVSSDSHKINIIIPHRRVRGVHSPATWRRHIQRKCFMSTMLVVAVQLRAKDSVTSRVTTV